MSVLLFAFVVLSDLLLSEFYYIKIVYIFDIQKGECYSIFSAVKEAQYAKTYTTKHRKLSTKSN